jgi:serine/threonine protein kinase
MIVRADVLNEGAAEQLLGFLLLDRWTVVDRIARDPGPDGESRTSCYRAVDAAGQQAFVKAFDFRHEDRTRTTEQLSDMLLEYNHEKRIHHYCADKRLTRVTRIYGAGDIAVNGETVHFIVCEYAPRSLREAHPPGSIGVAATARLIGLRKVAAGIAQLHAVGVAHQDIKPSNAVAYDDAEVKVTDLGSSSCSHFPPPPHDSRSFSGQPGYAPYELLYSHLSPTWDRRRIGCDLFLLGNLAFTSFVGRSLSYILVHALKDDLRHTVFTGTYDQVLPFLEELHFELVPLFVEQAAPACISKDLTSMILTMCHPDPLKRGHARNLQGSGGQYGLERYISTLDRLARVCELSGRNA